MGKPCVKYLRLIFRGIKYLLQANIAFRLVISSRTTVFESLGISENKFMLHDIKVGFFKTNKKC